MICSECGGNLKKTRSDSYHYIESGLSNVYLSRINVWICKECGAEEAEIPSIELLHNEIARLLVTKRKGLNPSEFRFLRAYLGFSGKDFANCVGVSPETISRWENKKVEIPQAVDNLLRHMTLLNKKNHEYSVESLAKTLEFRQVVRKMILSPRAKGWTSKVRIQNPSVLLIDFIEKNQLKVA